LVFYLIPKKKKCSRRRGVFRCWN